jgi:hypothetical protein
MSGTIYVQDQSGVYPEWHMNTTAPVNLILNYYYVSEVLTYDFSDHPMAG